MPYLLFKKLGHLKIIEFAEFSIEELESVIRSLPLKPRYPKQASETIISLSKMILNDYSGNASAVWENRLPVDICKTLTSVKGVGGGIAHMTIRILVDEWGYDPTSEGYKQIDVKPDVHVKRVFYRSGLTDKRDEKACVEAARKHHPEYPGELDWPAWEIGRKWCFEKNPKCAACPLHEVCLHRFNEN